METIICRAAGPIAGKNCPGPRSAAAADDSAGQPGFLFRELRNTVSTRCLPAILASNGVPGRTPTSYRSHWILAPIAPFLRGAERSHLHARTKVRLQNSWRHPPDATRYVGFIPAIRAPGRRLCAWSGTSEWNAGAGETRLDRIPAAHPLD